MSAAREATLAGVARERPDLLEKLRSKTEEESEPNAPEEHVPKWAEESLSEALGAQADASGSRQPAAEIGSTLAAEDAWDDASGRWDGHVDSEPQFEAAGGPWQESEGKQQLLLSDTMTQLKMAPIFIRGSPFRDGDAPVYLSINPSMGNESQRRVQAANSTLHASASTAAQVVDGAHSAASATLDTSRPVTTLVVRNLSDAITQQRFLEELDQSGFIGTYDFAYLPVKRRGHAFVNFKSAEIATAFAEQWHQSTRLEVRPGADALDVCSSSVQGFRENTAKWGPDRMNMAKNAPFIASTSRATSRSARDEAKKDITTFAVRNLSLSVTQQDFLQALDHSGFFGAYDFAYLPFEYGSGRGSGYAFVNFKNARIAVAFEQAWHLSSYLPVRTGAQLLDVAPASIQGFLANTSKWDRNRVSKVLNPKFLPFVSLDSVAASWSSQAVDAWQR